MDTQLIPKIRVDDAVRYFGSKAELARRLNITPQALTGWNEFIPELRVYRLRLLYPNEVEFMIKQASNGRPQKPTKEKT